MKRLLCVILALNLAVPVTWAAECPKPVTQLQEGQAAPCKGSLFSPEKEQEVRIKVEEHKLMEKEIKLKDLTITRLYDDMEKGDEIINLEREKAELWRHRAEDSTQKLIEANDGRGKRDWLFFALGILATGVAGYAIGQAAK